MGAVDTTPVVWCVDPATGQGYARPMTPEELAARPDQAAGIAAAQADMQAEANAITMADRIVQAITTLENAVANWSTITATQKDGALKLTVQVVVRLARLVLHRLEAAT